MSPSRDPAAASPGRPDRAPASARAPRRPLRGRRYRHRADRRGRGLPLRLRPGRRRRRTRVRLPVLHRAYLVQLRREGAGSALVDPIPFGDLSALGDAIVDAEWIIHAANQDLACLAEVGMVPRKVFDIELAGRLLGYPKVGLAPW